jgi:hypothetical protein
MGRPRRIRTRAAAGVGALAILSLTACESSQPTTSDHHSLDAVGCYATRPYAASSAWNTPIGPDPVINPKSGTYLNTLTTTGTTLTSDVDQYTIAVHCVTPSTPRTSVKFSGYYSDYTSGTRTGHGYAPTIANLPIPTNLVPPAGSDAQVVIWDQQTGIEYGFWQFAWHGSQATATNGYAIRTGHTAPGRFPDGLAGRGAGLPYLAGLVRPDEIAAGHIDHALAFAYAFPSREHVFPASKSDGKGTTGTDLPEGTRLQLDPTLTTADLTALGVTGPGLTVAKALQQYGMYVVDNSGSAKVYVERPTTQTAATSRTASDPTVSGPIPTGGATDPTRGINRTMLGRIPWRDFRVIGGPTP